MVSVDEFLSDSFDILIIGGGTAGLVLASHLSEDAAVRVGVLEAGPSRLDDENVEVPSRAGTMLGDSNYDWNFHSVPQVCVSSRNTPTSWISKI